MAIVTATEVTIFTDISVSAGTIIASGIIPIVQERINLITNNYFTTDMQIQGYVVFNSTAKTVVSGGDFEDEGFIAGDEIHIYNSYRNDGYKLVDSVLTDTITMASSETVYSEPSGRTVLVSVVQWPNALKYIAAQMVKYDYDDRPKKAFGVTSRTLGPFSEHFGTSSGGQNTTPFGYPQELIDALSAYTIARLN
jgi:hypothetical protein